MADGWDGLGWGGIAAGFMWGWWREIIVDFNFQLIRTQRTVHNIDVAQRKRVDVLVLRDRHQHLVIRRRCHRPDAAGR